MNNEQYSSRAIALFRKGWSIKQISEKLGMKFWTAERILRSEVGKKREDIKDEVRQHLKKGMTQSELARKYKVSPPTMYRWVKKWGFRDIVKNNFILVEDNKRGKNVNGVQAIVKSHKPKPSVKEELRTMRKEIKEAHIDYKRSSWWLDLQIIVHTIVVYTDYLLKMKEWEPNMISMDDQLNKRLIRNAVNILNLQITPFQCGDLGVKQIAQMVKLLRKDIRQQEPNYDAYEFLRQHERIIDQCHLEIKKFENMMRRAR